MASSSSSTKRQGLNESGNAFEEFIPASVTASSRNKLTYDVFIYHCGPDAKNTLAKDIYDALTCRGAKVFLHKKELELGVYRPTEIEKAMKSALLYIAIFSPYYAESPWCLAELSIMVETNKKIFPIFYRVKPADLGLVGKRKGIYASAFCRHEERQRYSPVKLQEWISALERISLCSGYIVDNYDDHGKVVDKIVKSVLDETRRSEYDIFISHRGLDTQKNVASLIYHRLIHCGLRVYLAEEDMKDGDILPSAISRIISQSSVHVAIFSVNYAESSWCLNELWKMLQSGCDVIPIFYDITCEDFHRIENGRCAKAFRIHQQKSSHLVERWKDALLQASNLPGVMEFNTAEDDLGDLVEKIVKKVLKKEEEASDVYDIFINHRGPDTKKTVASLIYHRLVSYGLRVFLDKEELEAGDILTPAIRSAISSSSVHVAIFSVSYVQSSWCLNELLDMLRSGGKVIPIFYDVEPADLRHIETGRYAKDFQDLQNKRNHQNNERRHKVELVDQWKDALRQASDISGMEFKTKEGHFANLVEEIVENVLKEVKWELLHVAEHPVGLRQAAEDFDKFLKERQLRGTTVVGIMGLNGLGKSTLVKHLYNCNLDSHKFKRYCFLELNKKDLAGLWEKLVRDLLGGNKYSISVTTKGKKKLQTCLQACGPVLIVLDGLDKEEQIESLLFVVKKKDVLARGSLILVTCHDKDLLKGQVNLFYEVNSLRGKDAHDLFCWYAFHSSIPPKELEDLVEKFLKICCGFPLALKDLGRKLYVDLDQNQRDGEENPRYWEENRRYWEEQLKELSRPKIPKDIVRKILKVVYDDLEEEKKEVFLDVAHFLVGEDTDLAVRVLERLHGISGLLCLKELQSKYLLDLEEIEHCKRPFAEGPHIQWRTKGSSKVIMHDLVRKMARQIASEDSRSCPKTKPVRLCQVDSKSILQQLQFSGHVKGIRCEYIDEPEWQDRDIKEPELPEMTEQEIYGLRLLVLHDLRVPFPSNRLSGDLLWLRMHKSNWGNIIPSTLSLRNLRVLEVDGVNFEALLDRMDGDKFPSKLVELTVDYCGESSSRVDKNSMEASSSPSGSVWDWFRFRELKYLIKNKNSIEASSSSSGSVWQLKYLVKMVLINVKGLRSLPVDFEALRNLRHLDLSGWSDLEEMPDSFTGLLQLQHLALQDCIRLSISDLGGITKLEYLDFEGCSSLRKLPEKTTAQRGLRHLNLMRTSIEELPEDLGELEKLEQLLITSSYLRTLPGSFHELGQLRILSLCGCPHLMDVSSSISIEHFPYLESLTEVQGLPCNLRRLYLMNFPLLTTLQCLSNLASVRILDISGCHNLEALNLDGLISLEEIAAKECWKLQSIQGLANLACIRILDISGCHILEALNLEGLTSIEKIAAKHCRKLPSIQGLANLACIRILDISGCHNLEALNL